MTNSSMADYLENLAKKIRSGTHEVSIEKTLAERKVICSFENGVLVEEDGGVDDSMYREVLRVTKLSGRILC